MLYTQAFQSMYYAADKLHNGRLPVHVRCIFDEFANVALPDDFERVLATCRSREISINIIIQNMAQLKALFKDSWENITGNCDTFLYLGGNEQGTFKYVSELLGKETIDTRTRSQSRGHSGSSSVNYQQAGRELLTPDEVRTLDNRNAILLIRGEAPVIDAKYPLEKHPNIKLTEDGGAAPYHHRPGESFEQEDLSLPFDNLDDIEILE
jgi:type IV secretion system protein VirD4